MSGIRDRVSQDGITADARGTGSRPPWDGEDGRDWHGHAYEVTLTYDGRQLVTPFYMGEALTGAPDAAEVLQSLVSDAATIENARSFEEWADELGFDPDSRKAEASYRQCLAQTETLKAFLADAYEAYLWDTEGL